MELSSMHHYENSSISAHNRRQEDPMNTLAAEVLDAEETINLLYTESKAVADFIRRDYRAIGFYSNGGVHFLIPKKLIGIIFSRITKLTETRARK